MLYIENVHISKSVNNDEEVIIIEILFQCYFDNDKEMWL